MLGTKSSSIAYICSPKTPLFAPGIQPSKHVALKLSTGKARKGVYRLSPTTGGHSLLGGSGRVRKARQDIGRCSGRVVNLIENV